MLLRVVYLGALLLSNYIFEMTLLRANADSFPNDSQIGHVDVNKYIEENPSAAGNNILCSEVTYPSLSIFYGLLGQTNLNEVTYNKVDTADPDLEYFPFMSVTHRGKTHGSTVASGALSGFASTTDHLDKQLKVCVHSEPVNEDVELTEESLPHLSVDWMVVKRKFSTNTDHLITSTTISNVGAGAVSCTNIKDVEQEKTIQAVILTASSKDGNAPKIANEHTVWIDSITQSGGKHKVTICAAVGNDATIAADEAEVIVNVLTLLQPAEGDLKQSIHEANPGTDYPAENGHVALETITSSSDESWTVMCIDKPFAEIYGQPPLVFTSISFRNKTEAATSAETAEPAIVSWVEFVNEKGFRGCASRPRYAKAEEADAAAAAAIPYLEYFVISQDGVLNSGDKAATLVTALTLTLKKDLDDTVKNAAPKIVNFYEAVTGKGTYDYNGYLDYSSDTKKVSFLVEISGGAAVATEVAKIEGLVNDDGNLAYKSDTDLSDTNAQAFRDAIFSDDQSGVKATFSSKYGCSMTKFDTAENAICSVATCGTQTTGTLEWTRAARDNKMTGNCPPASLTLPCNLPPCTFPPPETYSVAKTTPTEAAAAAETDLTWLWALLGVFGGLLLIALCFWGYKNYYQKIKSSLGRI